MSYESKSCCGDFRSNDTSCKIDDVFDIIVRLKEANVSNIMKTMSLENSSRLIQKLERYNKDKQKRD
ncbi:hypothetical protein MASR2M54_18410 [Aliarcobacter cryaerophilus]